MQRQARTFELGVKRMPRGLKPIDISNLPDLVRIAEEVRITGEPRVLRRGSEEVAVVMPIGPADEPSHASPSTDRGEAAEAAIWNDVGARGADNVWERYDPKRVKEALRRSAGALTGIDRDELLKDIYESRGQDSTGRPS